MRLRRFRPWLPETRRFLRVLLTVRPQRLGNAVIPYTLPVAIIPTAPRICYADLPSTLTNAQKLATLQPNLLMIDVEKGINIFQYLWPLVLATQATTQWPDKMNSTKHIPYAPGSAVVLDLWKANGKVGMDGYLDHIYFGDLNGKFYGLKFNMEDINKGMEIDFWQTKSIPSDDLSTDILRSDHEPISIVPAAALDRDNRLHLYFGTGKYDTIKGANNDKTETSTMSLYMVEDEQHEADDRCHGDGLGDRPNQRLQCRRWIHMERFWRGCQHLPMQLRCGLQLNLHLGQNGWHRGLLRKLKPLLYDSLLGLHLQPQCRWRAGC